MRRNAIGGTEGALRSRSGPSSPAPALRSTNPAMVTIARMFIAFVPPPCQAEAKGKTRHGYGQYFVAARLFKLGVWGRVEVPQKNAPETREESDFRAPIRQLSFCGY